ncbi:MAG: carbohydrate kinase [Nostoc sp. NMS7]|uniref:carbohydrate kinase family protein n=1 Tax=Nostoc sp. NMS7 TaxID=2815391 RepID=UPI0025E8B81E|nr:carbohydrate kinase family protein [Nostoc sp. NMS7]MBN3951973.1 carbohydrate kinase [Nostoc sp. NMS7]
MKNKNYFAIPQTGTRCAGTGLLALDVVINESTEAEPKFWAGGSCGNVLSILSYLGWESYPLSRLANDSAAEKIKNDLAQFKVRLDFVESSEDGSTPIIIEKIRTKPDGIPKHTFHFACPYCGIRLPRYKSLTLKIIQERLKTLTDIKAFYFDKVSPAAIELANAVRLQGGIVVFEPSGIGDQSLFNKALQSCHIIKYSHERLRNIEEYKSDILPLLQVVTLGEEGLRYIWRGCNNYQEQWQQLPAFEINGFKDAAGSGDWCTAGIIHLLGQNGSTNLEKASNDKVVEALRFGQALAAINCLFEGARGSMYILDRQSMKIAVEKVMLEKSTLLTIPEDFSNQTNIIKYTIQCVCPGCTKQCYSVKTNSQAEEQNTSLVQNIA